MIFTKVDNIHWTLRPDYYYQKVALSRIIKLKVGANCADLVCLHLVEVHWSGRRRMSPDHQDNHDDDGGGDVHGDDDHGEDGFNLCRQVPIKQIACTLHIQFCS